MKKVLVILLLLFSTLCFGGCKMFCKNHIDENNDYKCDKCGASLMKINNPIYEEHSHYFINGTCGCGVRKNNLYSLQEAFNSGWLTHNDLEEIAYYKNREGKYPSTLDDEIADQIIKDFCKEFNPDENDNQGSVRYFGKYNGCYVVMVDGCGLDYMTVLTSEIVDGVTFHYSSSQHMLVWRSNDSVDFQPEIVIDGEYCSEAIYSTVNLIMPIATSIVIENNKINNYEFKPFKLDDAFLKNIVEDNILDKDKFPASLDYEKAYFAEIKLSDDYEETYVGEAQGPDECTIGYYLTFSNSEMYLFQAGYNQADGYTILYGSKLTKVSKVLEENGYYIRLNGGRSFAYKENGLSGYCLEIVKTREELIQVCNENNNPAFNEEHANYDSNMSKYLRGLDAKFFSEYALIVYSTQINVDSYLDIEGITIEDNVIKINKRIVHMKQGAVVAIVYPWQVIIVVKQSYIKDIDKVEFV